MHRMKNRFRKVLKLKVLVPCIGLLVILATITVMGQSTAFNVTNSGGTSLLYVGEDGKVGIGTTSPMANGLQIQKAEATVYTGVAPVQSDSLLALANNQTFESAGAQAQIQFNVNGGSFNRVGSIGFIAESASNRKGALVFVTDDAYTRPEAMRITGDGNVGIGTTTPTDKLEVSGGNIRVTGGSFIDDGTTVLAPDYVFGEDYPLMSLDELQAYIARQKHLPNVPSAEDIRQNGLNLSEFQMRLLEKVEELTLYTIEQHQQIQRLQAQVRRLERMEAENAAMKREMTQFASALHKLEALTATGAKGNSTGQIEE